MHKLCFLLIHRIGACKRHVSGDGVSGSEGTLLPCERFWSILGAISYLKYCSRLLLSKFFVNPIKLINPI